MVGLVTDTGIKSFVDALVADNTVKHLGWGGGAGQGNAATDLASPFAESRASGTLVAATTTTTDDTCRITGSIAATAARDVTEVGVFAAPTGAELKIYGDFPAIALETADTIAFTIDVVIDQAT